jgi:hypothetical protein
MYPWGSRPWVLSQCEILPLFDEAQGLTGCAGAVITAGLLPGDLVVFHALIGFDNLDVATAALQLVSESFESRLQSHGLEDLGVRQEEGNVRVTVIVALPNVPDVFRLFLPGN